MQVTKHGHACLELTEGNEKLILDPGFYSEPLENLQNIVAVVITHIHDDHCYEEQLDRILKLNPDITIYSTQEVCQRLSNYKTIAVHHGDYFKVGNFTIEFFGDLHAEIHRSIPLVQNCGVFINEKLYYPGDSFTQPDRLVELLAVPTSAPWLKMSEVMDFVDEVKPKRSFSTHNALLSDFGNALNNSRVKLITESHGGEFTYLLPGESLTV